CAHTLLSSISFYSPRVPPHLHSFPTRRSSDLPLARLHRRRCRVRPALRRSRPLRCRPRRTRRSHRSAARLLPPGCSGSCSLRLRSEEHTSELQSPDHLVCRLLLEKKKKKSNYL